MAYIRQKWEYLVEEIFDVDLGPRLDHIGENGWELVAVTDQDAPDGCVKYIFKKPKESG